MNFEFQHTTPTSEISISLIIKQVATSVVRQYEDTNCFNKLCEEGCINYDNKWSCPPHSPSFSSYSNHFEHCILCLLHCDLSQFNYTKTEYMKIKASNSILKSLADKLSRILEINISGKALSTGSCRLCKPCAKKISAHAKCRNPLNLRYSLEALGLNVANISNELFSHELLWYSDKIAPKYSTVVCGLLTNVQLNPTNCIALIKSNFKPEIKLLSL